MPMHDWRQVKSGIYHNFHTLWISTLTNRLNAKLLPPGYFAMAEQIVGRPEADVVTLQTVPAAARDNGAELATAKPKTRFVMPIDAERYARKTHRIAIHHELGKVVAVIEVVSPGNKDRKHALQA